MLQLNKTLYEMVFSMRMVEERVRQEYPGDELKTPVHLSLGEEGIVAGVASALSPADHVFGTYRSHALYLARGGDWDAFFAELYGRQTGLAQGKAGSMHLSAPEVGFMASSAVVSSIIPVALGSAHVAKARGENRIAAVFFGDGATEEGVFWESANFASLMGLPVLFVCEDNGLAIHAQRCNRQAYAINEAVAAFGLRVFESRSTDPEVVRALTLEALEHMRATGKPALLHLHYHRYLEHVGICEDYRFGYRCKEDAASWYAVDPVALQRAKLLNLGMSEDEVGQIEKDVLTRIDGCVERAAKAPFAPVCALHEDVFA